MRPVQSPIRNTPHAGRQRIPHNPDDRQLALPDRPEPFLVRPRLNSLLAEGLSPSILLTVVQGELGTGKTMAVASYARDSALPVVWYSLTPREKDPVVFFEFLTVALKRKIPALSSRSADTLRTLGESGLTQAVYSLCDDLLSELSALILILDDCQHLPQGAAVLDAIDALIRHFPPQSQLAFSGRALPPIKLAQRVLRNEVLVVDDTALHFSATEVEELVGLFTCSPRKSIAAQLFEQTRGWVTGVVYALNRGPDSGGEALNSPKILHAFISQEFFDQVDGEFQRQLLTAAYLPQLDERHCREVMGPQTEAFLSRLEGRTTLVLQTGSVLRFNPLFQEFLQRECLLRLTPGERQELYRKLAESWWVDAAEAVQYLLRTDDWLAAQHRLTDSLPSFLQQGRLATVRALLEAFPPPIREVSGPLSYVEGEILRREGLLAESLQKLKVAEILSCRTLESAHQADDTRREFEVLTWIWASLAAVHGARGEPELQCDYAKRAIERLLSTLQAFTSGAQSIAELGRSQQCLAFCFNVLGLYHVYRHELDQAVEAFEGALELYEQCLDHGGQVKVLQNLGLTRARAGEFDAAISCYGQSIRLAEAVGLLPNPLTYNNLALTYMYRGDLTAGWSAATAGMALAEQLGARRDRLFLLWTIGHLRLVGGEFHAARDHFECSLAEAGSIGDRLSEMNAHLGLAELALRQGNPRQARHDLDRALASAHAKSIVAPELVEAALLQVECDLALGDLETARTLLEELSTRSTPHRGDFHEFHRARLWATVHALAGEFGKAHEDQLKLEDLALRHGYRLPPSLLEGRESAIVARSIPAVELLAMGPISLKVAGTSITARYWRGRSSVVALAYLILNPQGATKDRLLEVLHPTGDTGRSTLHMAINRLRQLLEPGTKKGADSSFILFQEGRYLFNPAVNLEFDVVQFRQLFAQARVPGTDPQRQTGLLLEAVNLYRGTFMEEFSNLPWCQLEAMNLFRAACDAFERLFAQAGQRDDWSALEEFADANLVVAPVNQAAFRAKLVALMLQGREQDARLLASRLPGLLSRQGGFDPEHETSELIQLISEGALTIKSARASLPSSEGVA